MKRYLISYSREKLMIRDRKTDEIKTWCHISRELADLILAIHYPKNPNINQSKSKLIKYNIKDEIWS